MTATGGEHHKNQDGLKVEGQPIRTMDSEPVPKLSVEEVRADEVDQAEGRTGHKAGDQYRQLQIGVKVPVEGSGKQGRT